MGDGLSLRARVSLLCCSLMSVWGCSTALPHAGLEGLRSPPSRYATPLLGPIHTVVIDAGHGGQDGGATHYGLKEKYLALDVAKRLRSALDQAGFTVVMTRETDTFLPLSRRPAVANSLPADVFVSVHINANRDHGVSGTEVYYPRVSVVSPSAPWPPSVAPSEVGVPTLTIKHILWDLVLGRTRAQSHQLASMVCGSLHEGLHASCKAKPARFVVLREAWMPAVLVEVGYVSNGLEAQRLNTPDYRQAAAESVAQGIIAYAQAAGAEHI